MNFPRTFKETICFSKILSDVFDCQKNSKYDPSENARSYYFPIVNLLGHVLSYENPSELFDRRRKPKANYPPPNSYLPKLVVRCPCPVYHSGMAYFIHFFVSFVLTSKRHLQTNAQCLQPLKQQKGKKICLHFSYCLFSRVNQFKAWYFSTVFDHPCHQQDPLGTVT